MQCIFRVTGVTEAPIREGDLEFDGYRFELTGEDGVSSAVLFAKTQEFENLSIVKGTFELSEIPLGPPQPAETNG